MNDVRRARSALLAALLAGVALIVIVLLAEGPGRALSPPAVSLPHVQAGLECGSCHQEERSASEACVGCHGAQRSSRRAHQQLSSRGELSCGDCHRAHGAEGVRVDELGALTHFVADRERPADPAGALLRAGAALPLVAAERCVACHDAASSRDPAAHCFSPRSAANLCFDEHASAAAGHSALAEAARSVALNAADQAGPSLARSAFQLGLAFGVGLVGWFVTARRRRRASTAAVPAPPLRRLPVIDAARCLGCSACVDACPHDVFEVARHVAVVARPDACCGLALCAERCPNGSLSLSGGEITSSAPRLSPALESLDEPGVFLAGDVTGQSLIRSAVRQGAQASRAVERSLAAERSAVAQQAYDLAIIGAGPAGLAAALEAARLGLKAVVLEQGRMAESIQSFARDKIVLDQGTPEEELPLWVGECRKEELVRRWLREVRAAKLELREHARVVARRRARASGLFELELAGVAERLLARRVVVAVGRRGSPRQLDAAIPEAALGRVHYALSDARSFAGRRVVVVGLGDSAMEAALALAAQPGTSVHVVYRGSEHRRGKRRNIEEFRRLCEAGRIHVAWSTEIRRVELEELALDGADGERTLRYDALFVLIGGEAGEQLLPRAGASG